MNMAEQLSIEFSVLSKSHKCEWLFNNNGNLSELENVYKKLKDINLSELIDDNDKKAFWINIYNGLVNYFIVKMKIKNIIPKHILFFSNIKADIGGYKWSLNDIEHGILRKNKRTLNSLRVPFKNNDPRKKYILNEEDPRIHFALNCGAKSCPTIKAYTSRNINNELKKSEDVFIQFEIEIDDENCFINASKIFYWYKKDFKGKYIYLDKFKGYKIKYKKYDWNLI